MRSGSRERLSIPDLDLVVGGQWDGGLAVVARPAALGECLPEMPDTSDRDLDYDQAAVDAYLEHWLEFEADAQYEAWRSGIGEPFDFTGRSYLDEYTPPLRDRTPLMDRFDKEVSAARATMAAWGEWPELTKASLEFIADLSETIHTDGDYFLQKDPEFLGDRDRLKLCGTGVELASRSRDFWERLIEIGPTSAMVREANHLLLLRGADDDESLCRRADLEEACMDYLRPVERAKATGGDMFASFKEDIRGWGTSSGGNGAFRLYHGLGRGPETRPEELLACLVRRDRAGALRILDGISSANETEARKAGLPSYDSYEVERVPGAPMKASTYGDVSFLRIAIVRRAVSSHMSQAERISTTTFVGRRACPRERASRGRSSPIRGSRRVSSRSTSGAVGDDPDPEPLASKGCLKEEPPALDRIRWEMTTTGFGIALGGVVGMGLEGVVIGALVAYAWSRRRWPGNN